MKLSSKFFLKENKHDYSSSYYRLRPHRSQRPPRFFTKKKKWPDVKIVAINDTAKPEATVHLTKFDTTHGKFNGDVYWDDGHLVVNGDRIFMCSERDPKKLPWKDLDVDIVLECTGAFRDKEGAMQHIEAGARKF